MRKYFHVELLFKMVNNFVGKCLCSIYVNKMKQESTFIYILKAVLLFFVLKKLQKITTVL